MVTTAAGGEFTLDAGEEDLSIYASTIDELMPIYEKRIPEVKHTCYCGGPISCDSPPITLKDMIDGMTELCTGSTDGFKLCASKVLNGAADFVGAIGGDLADDFVDKIEDITNDAADFVVDIIDEIDDHFVDPITDFIDNIWPFGR